MGGSFSAHKGSLEFTQSHNLNPTQECDFNPQISQREVGKSHKGFGLARIAEEALQQP
jgi:hypothetical protein